MGKDKNNIDIIKIPKECRYCGNEVVFTSNAEIYGKEYGNGKCFLCRNCKAFVGVHTKTLTPLGTLANNELRKWRNKAHNEFDKLWKSPTRIMTRHNSYRWLSEKLNLELEYTHIALFEIEQCQRTIQLVKEKFNENKSKVR